MFEFLFKYPAELFAEGRLISLLSGWQFALLPLGLALLGFFLLGYFRLRGRMQTQDWLAILLLRGLALSMLVFSLTRPLLEVTALLPQPGLVGLLLDNSRSMTLTDSNALPRSEFITRQLATGRGELLASLRQRFDLRLFQFGAATQTLAGVEALDFADGSSDLVKALEFVQETLRGEPLAGLVIVTDGALQSSAALDELLSSLRAARIPVYSIGLGTARYARDIELSQVNLPAAVLNGSRVMADVSIRQRGYDGTPVELLVEDDSQILHRQQLRLRPGLQSLRFPLATEEAGARRLEFHLTSMEGEQVGANNRRQAMLAVNDRKMRILYYEGEPRFEMKFVRRAVADDANLAVTGLIRTADAKYYRVGIEDREALRHGFPITRDELFSYDAIILGSVDSSLLSHEQQEMIIDFVSERGGGLLMLGGRHAFTEGGYRDSVLHAISPVVMPEQPRPEFHRQIRIQPTAAAWVHPALLLADSSEASIARWLTLPPLTMVNPIRRIKPGATLLLSGPADADGDPYVAMAWQRYGRGKVVAFPVQNSWLWQMHQEIDLEDQSHELLWRQLLRWLVESVPSRLSLTLSSQRIHAGGVVRLRSEALQADFSAASEASVRAILTAQDGSEQVIPLAPHASLAGVYEKDLTLINAGEYQLRVEHDAAEKPLRSDETRLLVTRDGDEFFNSERNDELLRHIAQATDGAVFEADDAGRLLDALDAAPRGSRTLVRYELWDMPLLFILIVTLLCTEWAYRRWRGLT